jgi:5'-nucleotidase
VLYSGTIGGAMEAALQGLPAVALSQFLGPETRDLDDPFEAARSHGVRVLQALLAQGDWSDRGGYRTFYNVNFPPCPASVVRGTRVAAQGLRLGSHFTVEPQTSPTGRRFLWVRGGAQGVRTAPGTDVAANLDGYIAVTPLRADLTAHDLLAPLAEALA